jgi:hypothetical protein
VADRAVTIPCRLLQIPYGDRRRWRPCGLDQQGRTLWQPEGLSVDEDWWAAFWRAWYHIRLVYDADCFLSDSACP